MTHLYIFKIEQFRLKFYTGAPEGVRRNKQFINTGLIIHKSLGHLWCELCWLQVCSICPPNYYSTPKCVCGFQVPAMMTTTCGNTCTITPNAHIFLGRALHVTNFFQLHKIISVFLCLSTWLTSSIHVEQRNSMCRALNVPLNKAACKPNKVDTNIYSTCMCDGIY